MDECKFACPLCCSLPALGFAVLFAFGCQSWSFEALNPLNTSSVVRFQDLEFGPWYQKETEVAVVVESGIVNVFTRDVCVKWDEDFDLDSKMKAVRAFTIITVTLGALLSCLIMAAPFSGAQSRVASAWMPAACCFTVVLTLFQGLSFLYLLSDACENDFLFPQFANSSLTQLPLFQDLNQSILDTLYKDECEWEVGSTLNAVAVGCWFLTGLVMLAVGTPGAEYADTNNNNNADDDDENDIVIDDGPAPEEQPLEKEASKPPAASSDPEEGGRDAAPDAAED